MELDIGLEPCMLIRQHAELLVAKWFRLFMTCAPRISARYLGSRGANGAWEAPTRRAAVREGYRKISARSLNSTDKKCHWINYKYRQRNTENSGQHLCAHAPAC